jgi:TolA-binding protein
MHKVNPPERAWERVAAELRAAPPELDEFARARMERQLVDRWRGRSAAAVPLPRTRRLPSRSAWVLSVAVSAAAGVLLGLYALRDQDGVRSEADSVVAHFELVIDDGAVQTGYLTEGQTLESGKHGQIEVGLGQSRVDIAPETRVRFERLSRKELRLSLVKGRVEVAFHPEHRGEEQMSIETRAARVLVVGTRFDVTADASGNTQVRVSEGVVQVVPRRGGATKFVKAGEQLAVQAVADDEREQAMRDAIAARIAREGEAALGDEPVQDQPENGPNQADASQAGPLVVTADVQAPRDQYDERGQVDAAAGEAGMPPARRLEAARRLLIQGKHGAARERLQKLARMALPTGDRVEALVLIAESYTAQGQIPRATEAYREAARIAPRHPAGHNALFALARLIERYTDDRGAAGEAYREYLARAPKGPLSGQARSALCRLGDAASCRK